MIASLKSERLKTSNEGSKPEFHLRWIRELVTRISSAFDFLTRCRLGYLSDLGECLGDHALTELRRFQMADKPPSTDNSTPFTKLESSEARNSATVAISSG